ncbi:MAG: hypothetical protein HUK24_04335 [Sphaerochaetaceae bacterium]|nr:hypothetical protein [Sphaerochaetaceae bacterium]
MKKTLIVLLMIALCSALFAGAGLSNAASFVKANYDKSSKANPAPRTTADFEVYSSITVKNVTYTIAWSTDTEYVKVVTTDGPVVKIDIDEGAPQEMVYTLVATITDPTDGATQVLSMQKTLPQGSLDPSYEEIVLDAYKLADGEAMPKTARLAGKIVSIPTVYSEQYNNITVNIQVGALADNIIQCYRLKGGADLKVGDIITVEGKIKNYKGTIEFDSGAIIVAMGDCPDQSAKVDAAYLLADGETMKGAQILYGVVDSIPTAYSEQYGNITVNIIPTGDTRVVQAYRLKGNGAKDIKVGDTIAIYGNIKNYKGTIEFDKDCLVVNPANVSSVKTLLKAYELEDGKALEGARQVTGTIVSIPSAYSEQYGNITVNMVTDGIEALTIQCYRLKGGADLKVGDTITVSGNIKNYKGTIEFDKDCTYVK